MEKRYYEILRLSFTITNSEKVEKIKEEVYGDKDKNFIEENREAFTNNYRNYLLKKAENSESESQKKTIEDLVNKYIAILPHKDFNGEFLAVFFDKEKTEPGCVKYKKDEEKNKFYIL